MIRDTIRDAVMAFRDEARWDAMLKQEVEDRRYIESLVEGNMNEGDEP